MSANLLVDITSTASGSSPGTWGTVPGLSATGITVQGTGSVLLLVATVTQNDTGDQNAEYRFYVNGAAITNGPVMNCFSDNSNGERSGMTLVYAMTGLSGSSNSFVVQWQTMVSAPSIETDVNHSLQVIEIVDSASILVNSFSTGSGTAPGTEANLFQSSGISVAGTGSVLLMLANVPVAYSSDGSTAFRFGVDNTAEGHRGTAFGDAANELTGWSGIHAKTGISGSHSFELKWQSVAGSGLTNDTGRTRTFQVVEFTAGCEILDSVITAASQSTTTAWANDGTLTTTQSVTSDALQLIFANACRNPGGTDGCVDISIGIGGTNVGGALSMYNDSTSMFQGGCVAWAETGLTGSNTFQMRLRHVQAGSIHTSYNRSLFVLEFTPTAELEQEGFRYYDDGTESGSTALEAQDTDITIGKETTFQLRALLNATGDPASEQYQLEYKETGDGAGEYRKVPTS